MQSKNYVPGVSGWKLHADTGFLEISGVMRVGGLLGADVKAPEPAPFIIVDGVTYVRQAKVSEWSVKLSVNSDGQHVAAGVGIPLKLSEPKIHFPDAFRDLIHEELHKALKPGGFLHRR